MDTFDKQRKEMIVNQIRARGVKDEIVLSAMSNVRRESFVPDSYRELAYSDGPLPIGQGQTISQPYVVAFMIEALGLKGGEKVLEIGAGSGYAAAVLAEIADEVFAIERIARLADYATSNLDRQGYENVHILHSDGTLGWPEHAPFDAILVSAAAPEVPEILKNQMVVGGRMVIPVGVNPNIQQLLRVTLVKKNQFEIENLGDVGFVPLIGHHGWEETQSDAIV